MHSPTVTTLTLESIAKNRSWCIARGHSENTAKAYSADLRMLLQFHQTDSIPMEDYEWKAQEWLNQTRKTAAPKTTGRRLTSLRAFARWAKWPTELSEYRAPTPSKPMPHPLPERMEGIDRLIKAASNYEQEALIASCGLIGLRISEALAFHTSWLNTESMLLTVRGKGDKERIVPVSERAWLAISTAYVRAMIGDGYLIHYQDRSARKCVTALGRKAGLKRAISSHDLRATYATALGENNVPPRVVQELLGHASLADTEVYMGVHMDALRSAVEEI